MRKKIFLKILLGVGIILIVIIGGLYTNIIKLPIIRPIPSPYFVDNAGGRFVEGASDYILTGKVLKQVGTKRTGVYPETQYEVEVIENLKGNLQGTIIVDQIGGYKNGIFYQVPNDIRFEIGPKHYSFNLKYNAAHQWYTLVVPAQFESYH